MTLRHKVRRLPLGNLSSATNNGCGNPAPNLTVRVGCRLVYETIQPAPILLLVRPRPDNQQIILQESLTFRCEEGAEEFQDVHGNITHRWVLPPGQTVIIHDALVQVSSLPDNFNQKTYCVPIEDIPSAILRYTLPSRYCDSDKMLTFSAGQFGSLINGVDRVIAVCNWVHQNIRYVTCSGRPDISASEVMAR